MPILGCIGNMIPRLREMVQQRDGFLVLLRNRGNHSNPASVDEEIQRLAKELRVSLEQVQAGLKDYAYPFSHSRGQLSLREYAQDGRKCDHEYESIYLESSAHVERLFSLHYRALGRLLVIASVVEKALGSSEAVTKEAETNV